MLQAGAPQVGASSALQGVLGVCKRRLESAEMAPDKKESNAEGAAARGGTSASGRGHSEGNPGGPILEASCPVASAVQCGGDAGARMITCA